MPIVNVNLSMAACAIYAELANSRRASRIISRLLIEWKHLSDEERADLSTWNPIVVELGDRRMMSDGQWCAFTDKGWTVIEE